MRQGQLRPSPATTTAFPALRALYRLDKGGFMLNQIFPKSLLALAWLSFSTTIFMAVPLRAADGRFPVLFQNLAHADYPDDSVFIYALGVDANGKWCRSLPDGSML